MASPELAAKTGPELRADSIAKAQVALSYPPMHSVRENLLAEATLYALLAITAPPAEIATLAVVEAIEAAPAKTSTRRKPAAKATPAPAAESEAE